MTNIGDADLLLCLMFIAFAVVVIGVTAWRD